MRAEAKIDYDWVEMSNLSEHYSPTTGKRLGLIIIMVAIGGVVSTFWAKNRWWFPPVTSQHGVDVDRLVTITFIVTGFVFVLVHLVLGIFVWRYAAAREERAIYWHDHRTLELTYTLVPAAILLTLISMGAVTWARVHSPVPPQALRIDVLAQQFAWTFRYPGPDGTFGRTGVRFVSRDNPRGMDPSDPAGRDDIISREMHIVVNQPAVALIHSRDVLHSFFLPNFRVKQDAVPGMTTEFWFTPTREGRYELACAELCGVGHYIMRAQVVVESKNAFETWLAGQTH